MEDHHDLSLLLESLKNDVAQIGPTLRHIAETVIEENISEFPVFIAAQEIVDLGKPIFDREEIQLNWFFNASILEDFQRKGLVQGENLLSFKRTFGDPLERACIFVVTPEVAQFVFVPYEVEGGQEL